MPTNNADQIDPRDARINELELQIDAAAKKIDELAAELSAAQASNEKLSKKLGAAKSAPTGDVVTLGGKSYAVLHTVRANATFDEVKKGHVDEGRTLVVIDRFE